jgi:hypothetical protein
MIIVGPADYLAFVSDLLTTCAMHRPPSLETFKITFLNTDGASFEIGFTMSFFIPPKTDLANLLAAQ